MTCASSIPGQRPWSALCAKPPQEIAGSFVLLAIATGLSVTTVRKRIQIAMTTKLRSETIEEKRMQDLLGKLHRIGMLESAVKQADINIVGQDNIWKTGVEPPPFDEFCTLLDDRPMFERQLDVWESIQMLRASHILSPDRTITECILEWGKGSGKGYLVAKLICYIIYIYHQLKIPAYEYISKASGKHVAPATTFDIINVAPTEALAMEVFYTYMRNFLSSPLMKDIPTLPKKERWGQGTDTILFPAINFRALSKSSNSAGTDGPNTLIGVIDEGDAFLDNQEKSTAMNLHDILRRTAIGRFGNMALILSISYPRLEEGYMRRLRQRALKANERLAAEGKPPIFYCDQATTAEVRPDFDLQSPEIQEEFLNDPTGAAAMYLCEPSTVEHKWIEFPERINQAVDIGRLPAVDWHTEVTDCSQAKDGSDMRVTLHIDNIRKLDTRMVYVGVDGGVSGDSFGIAGYSYSALPEAYPLLCPNCGGFEPLRGKLPYRRIMESRVPLLGERCGRCGLNAADMVSTILPNIQGWWELQQEGGVVLTYQEKPFNVPILREEFLIEVKPERRKGVEGVNARVDFESVQDGIETIINTLGVREAGYDQYQTVSMMQYMATHTKSVSTIASMTNPEQLKRARLYKQLLYRGAVRNIENDKRDRQFRRLIMKNGRIDHPPNPVGQFKEGKDLYDPEAIAIFLAVCSACSEIKLYL